MSSCVEIVAMQDSQTRTKPSADTVTTDDVPAARDVSRCAGYEEADETGNGEAAVEPADLAVPEDLTESDDDKDLTDHEDLKESDDEDDDLTKSKDPSSSSDNDEDLTDAPEDLTDPEDTPASQRTVNRKHRPRSKKQRSGDPSTGHSRSRRHKYIWAERRALRMTNLKVARALRAKPASAREALMHRRSIVEEMCTFLTHHDAVAVFNQLKVHWMLRDPYNASMVVCMRGVLRQNPEIVWRLLTEHKSTVLDLRKAALDPTVSLAMNTHPSHTQAPVAPRLATFRPPLQPRTPTEKLTAILSRQNAVMRRTRIALMAQCTTTDGRPLYPISPADAALPLLRAIILNILYNLTQSQEDIINTFAPATFMQAAQARRNKADLARVRAIKGALLHATHGIPLRMQFMNHRKPCYVLIGRGQLCPQSITVQVLQAPTACTRFRWDSGRTFKAARNNAARASMLCLCTYICEKMQMIGNHLPDALGGLVCAYSAQY
jgi:hypothetical protein